MSVLNLFFILGVLKTAGERTEDVAGLEGLSSEFTSAPSVLILDYLLQYRYRLSLHASGQHIFVWILASQREATSSDGGKQ